MTKLLLTVEARSFVYREHAISFKFLIKSYTFAQLSPLPLYDVGSLCSLIVLSGMTKRHFPGDRGPENVEFAALQLDY